MDVMSTAAGCQIFPLTPKLGHFLPLAPLPVLTLELLSLLFVPKQNILCPCIFASLTPEWIYSLRVSDWHCQCYMLLSQLLQKQAPAISSFSGYQE